MIISAVLLLLLLTNTVRSAADQCKTVYISIEKETDIIVTCEHTLANLLISTYDTKIAYGILYELGSLKTDFVSSYIVIYIDGSYAQYGINNIILNDGSTYSFYIISLT